MGDVLDARRQASNARLADLTGRLTKASAYAGSNACVYATGSFAREEASEHSDLDLFIVGRTDDGRRLLTRLDEICIKSELISATRELRIPEFSGDGAYLKHYTVDQLVKHLGTPNDDSLNTFTARLGQAAAEKLQA
jgi:predicted nucleotidyltransferase